MDEQLSRKEFLKQLGVISGGLIIGLNVVSCEAKKIDLSKLDRINPNIWITILENGTIYLVVHRSEMGQGIRTSLAAVLADEMEADITLVKIEQAIGHPKYGSQNTDGSRSVRNFFTTLRKAGASVKELMEESASKKWNISKDKCFAKNHFVYNKDNTKKIAFGDLLTIAKTLKLNEEPKLKNKSDFRYIGTELDNIDNELFVSGKAVYGIDATIDNMVYASILRTPVASGTIESVDKSETLKFPGVIDVIEIKGKPEPYMFNPQEGVAVIATNTWAAEEGKKRLKIKWKSSPHEKYDSESYKNMLINSVHSKGESHRNDGDVYKSFKKNKKQIEATYYLPHLVHAPMETPNALAWVKEDSCEVWASTQTPQAARRVAAQELGWEEDKVTVNVTFLGGGFGRKSKPDYVVEAVRLSKLLKKPVKIFWSREDDIRNGYYHSVSAQYHKAALDKKNNIDAWLHRSDFPPISATFNPAARGPGSGVNQAATTIPFSIPNIRIEAGKAEAHVRIGWLRSVYSIFHGFSTNCFVDELAHLRGIDPLKHYLELIGDNREINNYSEDFVFDTSRLKNVLTIAAKNANWGKKLPEGHGMGLAVQYSFFSYVAQIVEVDMSDGKLKVVNVNAVIDCGQTVNHDSIKNQIEGASIFGLSLAMYGNITAKDGKIEQSNFHDYQMTRMNQAPEIHVEIVETDNPSTGVGEPGVPPFAPALVNAIFNATGKRYRELPLMKHDIII